MKRRTDPGPRPPAGTPAGTREAFRLIRELLTDLAGAGSGSRHTDRNATETARWLEFLSGQRENAPSDRRTWERLRLFLRNRRREWQHRATLRLRAREQAINTLFEAFRSLHAQVNTTRYLVHEILDDHDQPQVEGRDVAEEIRFALRALHQRSEGLMREVGPSLEQIRAEMLAEGEGDIPEQAGAQLDQAALMGLVHRYAAAGRLFGEPMAVLRIAADSEERCVAAVGVLTERFRRRHDTIVRAPDGALIVFALDLPERHLQSMGVQTAVDLCGTAGPAVRIGWTTLGPAEDPGGLLLEVEEAARPARDYSEA